MPTRNASAKWTGTFKGGGGTFSTGSGAIKATPYSFSTRFEEAPGTNPEELIGAAYASCYAMALVAGADKAGLKPESVEAKATVTFEPDTVGFKISKVHLDVTAKIGGTNAADFATLADNTKKGCPIGKLLVQGTAVSVSAKLL